MHRGSQGVRLISLEGKRTGDVAAVQQVTELDEELLLISAAVRSFGRKRTPSTATRPEPGA